MSAPSCLPNQVMVFTAIRAPERDYLNFLGTFPGLTTTKTVLELISVAVAEFLLQKPWLLDPRVPSSIDPSFRWIKPESYYTLIGGERHDNGDWSSHNVKIGDVTLEDGRIITSKVTIDKLTQLAENVVIPSLIAENRYTHGNAQNTTLYTIILWTIHKLYPPAKYSPSPGYESLLQDSWCPTLKPASPAVLARAPLGPALPVSQQAFATPATVAAFDPAAVSNAFSNLLAKAEAMTKSIEDAAAALASSPATAQATGSAGKSGSASHLAHDPLGSVQMHRRARR